ncbi:MAG: hypothetical protein GY940_18550 [bacterium]|nr:hypothetical protein [bacterium]
MVYSNAMSLKNISIFKWIKKAVIYLALLVAVLVVAFVAFYFWAGSGTLPEEKLSEIISYHDSTPQSPGNTGTFTIMTYNIGYLSGMTNNQSIRPGKELFDKNMRAVVTQLKKNPPDIITFQEIDYDSKRSYYVEQLQTIAVKAGYTYGAKAVNWDNRYVPFPYWPPSVHFGKVLSGQAVLSRWPISNAERIVLEKPESNAFYYNKFYLDRLIQVVKIGIGGHTLVVLNVHLEAFDQETRESQVQRVMETYRSYKDNYPVLLIGDFNAPPPDALQKKNFADEPEADFTTDKTIAFILKESSLKAAFMEVPAEKNQDSVFTFPSDKPTRKLDYIFYHHEKITLVSADTVRIDSSDLLPLVVRFSFASNGEE